MSIFVSSDLHFFHSNIIKYCPESRGHFTSIDEMNETIVENFNSVIRPTDHLILVGDIGFASPEKVVWMLSRLNGTKTLIWGNHDKKFRKSAEYQANISRMKIAHTSDYHEMSHTHKDGEKFNFVFGHFPFSEWDRKHHGTINCHGHCHSPSSRKYLQGTRVRQIDIGVDGNFMMPYNLDDICDEMRLRQDFRSHHYEGEK